MVAVDGRQVRVQALGLERRRPGTPIVVLEAGSTNSLDIWNQVVPGIAAVAPVVAYDRAGLGQSEWDGAPPTPAHSNRRLRLLLAEIGAEPPYLLVGFSWGGVLVHTFAGAHPREVAGLVFVDPAPVATQTRADALAPFESIGAGRAGYDAYWSTFQSLVANAPPAIRGEVDQIRALAETEPAHRGVQPLPAVPMVVIVAAKYREWPFSRSFPFDARAHFDADLRVRIGMLREWTLASPDGLLVVSNRTTHVVPREEPELITWAIRRVLDSIVGSTSPAMP